MQEFEGNEPPEPDILGLVGNTHPATAELFDDAVVGDGLPDQRRGVRHLADMLGCVQGQVNEESRSARRYKSADLAAEVQSHGWFSQ